MQRESGIMFTSAPSVFRKGAALVPFICSIIVFFNNKSNITFDVRSLLK